MGISSPRLRTLLGEGTGIHTAREIGAVRAGGLTLVEGDIASDLLCQVYYMGRLCGPVRLAPDGGYLVAGKSRDLRFAHLSSAALVAAATAIEAHGLAILAADDSPDERPEPDGALQRPPS